MATYFIASPAPSPEGGQLYFFTGEYRTAKEAQAEIDRRTAEWELEKARVERETAGAPYENVLPMYRVLSTVD